MNKWLLFIAHLPLTDILKNSAAKEEKDYWQLKKPTKLYEIFPAGKEKQLVANID